MFILPIEFKSLDLRNATEKEYGRLGTFKNILNLEYHPDDPPVPIEEQIQGWKNLPDYIEYEAYSAWDDKQSDIIAYCESMIYHTGDNEHAGSLRIEVLREYRNKGIARQALKLLLPFIKKHKRTLMISTTCDQITETGIWFEHLGGRPGLRMRTSQMRVSEFDRSLVNKWLKESESKLLDFDLYFTDGVYPDEIIGDIAGLFQEVSNDAPRENLEVEDINFTPEILREDEQSIFARGNKRWTMYLTDRHTGKVAGLTEVFWNPNRGTILNQGFTGVYPEYRNKGLGRWLKAEMTRKILAELPEVEFIRTNNANSNAPMLKINVEMGFKPYLANTLWQVDTVQIENYLNRGAN